MFNRIVIALLLCPLMAMGTDTMNITSFETETDLQKITFNNTNGELVTEHATDGGRALKIHFQKVEWPGIGLAAKVAYEQSDWSAFGALMFDVHNPEKEEVRVSVRVDDNDSADGRKHCSQGWAKVPPGATRTLLFPLRNEEFNMRGQPPAPVGIVLVTRDPREIELSHVTKFLIFLGKPEAEHTLYIDNIRLGPIPRPEGIVDRFGQYSLGEWLGKLHDESEFAKRREEEAEELKGAPQPSDRDEYGGWANGPQREATGFFRVEKVDGKWWLVTPNGHLFWSIGLDAVRFDYIGTPTKGREYMFTWLPKPEEPAYRFMQSKALSFSFYSSNLPRKYGEDFLPAWLDVTFKRMRTWGFNTIGNWSSSEVFRARKIPYTVPIHYKGVSRFEMARKTIVDVFDENFAKAVDSAIEDVTQEWREDPWCIGYFVDNELQWGQGDRERGYDLPRNVLASTGDLAAKGEFVSRLRENYGEIEKLNNAWGITVESWEQFADKPVSLPKEPSKALVSDQSDFLSHFARRYFTVVRDAMKRHAPNQLYLGCRIASRAPEEVARLQAEFADVVSYNWYCRPENFVERTAAAAALGRPVIIGEFHFGATDRGMFHTGLGPVANQEERGKSYAAYVAEALKQPWCVGAHWFTYIDEPLTGRFDGENYNIGFMNVTDTPYPELSAAAREINFRIYEIRGRQ